MCPDDYKRLRTLRRKRNQNTLYNLRSVQPEGASGEPTPPPQGSVVTAGQDEYAYDGSDSEPEEQIGSNGMVSERPFVCWFVFDAHKKGSVSNKY